MKLHVLSIGQADALVLELPSGRLAVVDFGHDALLSYLAALDPTMTRRFAFCLLTHAHHDHYACLEQFINRYDARVDEYWYSFCSTNNLPTLLAFKVAATRGHRGRLLVQDLPAAQPFMLEDGVEVTRFAPNTWEVERTPSPGESTTENNRSVVLLLRYGLIALILGADAEEARWTRIEGQARAAQVSLAADVVKAPHHGATPPHGLPERLWPLLLRSTDTFVVFSAGRGRGKPALSTITTTRGARIQCTGRALVCRPLPAPTPAYQPAQDLVSRALAPAPEAATTQTCFGSQVYEFNPAGIVTQLQAEQPAFLDACLSSAP